MCFVLADIISTVEFNPSGELLATGDKGGRVVVFQREQGVRNTHSLSFSLFTSVSLSLLPLISVSHLSLPSPSTQKV